MRQDQLPPPAINRQPTGLLDFFGIKNGGRYPEQLLPVLSPTIELWNQYVASNAEESTFANNAVAPAGALTYDITSANWLTSGPIDFARGAATTVVPSTELWYFAHFSLYWSYPTVGTAFGQFFPYVGMGPNGVVACPIVDFNIQQNGSATFATGGITCARAFFAKPGSRIGFFSTGCAGPGNLSVTGAIRLVRMRI